MRRRSDKTPRAILVGSVSLMGCAALLAVDSVDYAEPDASVQADAADSAEPEGGAVDAAADAAADAGLAGCRGHDGGGGPESICVNAGLGRICVDATEVTSEDYKAFTKAMADASALAAVNGVLPAVCAMFVSSDGVLPSEPAPGGACAPIVFVTLCQAHAYCRWRGKHLCGRIDGGAPLDDDAREQFDASASEWMYACTQGGKQDYAYGGPARCVCNTAGCDGGRDSSVPVGNFAACLGGLPGVHDMNGNVDEWEDAYDPSNSYVVARGGSFVIDYATAGCGYEHGVAWAEAVRGGGNAVTGFRCCGE